MKQDEEIISSGVLHEVHLPEGSKTAVHKTATPMEPQIRNTLANPDETVELIEVVKGVTHNQVEEERLAQLAQLAQAGSKIEKARSAAQAQERTDTDRMVQAESSTAQDRFAQTPDSQDEAPRMAQAEDAAATDRLAGEPDPAQAAQMAHAVDAAEPAEHLVDEDSEHAPQLAHTSALPLDQVLSDLPSLDLPVSQADLDVTQKAPPAAPEEDSAPGPAAQETLAQADTTVAASVDSAAAVAPKPMEDMNFPARVVKLKIANDQIRGQIEKLEKPLFAPIPVAAPAPAKAAKGKEKEAAKKPAKGH